MRDPSNLDTDLFLERAGPVERACTTNVGYNAVYKNNKYVRSVRYIKFEMLCEGYFTFNRITWDSLSYEIALTLLALMMEEVFVICSVVQRIL